MSDLLIPLAVFASLFAVIANAARARNAGARGRLHWAFAVIAAYFTIVYALTWLGVLSPVLVGGQYLRPALIVLMVALGAAAIAYWSDD